ncbi:mechanosensitive ion channel family protein [Dethiobacter alkaliphilus]|uniref:mechanosensitive ion channel family protein n=1 Tax=Dethiobacter alkaliphilus TaxID=427926 RepID=UPI002227A2D7|nr:mechanosensitive ion channel family protein [Dethiobacter alkaliphilus]MCW3488958.1 mechanosensitive ion channel family protein [Dethiobacter alkaliphilus]
MQELLQGNFLGANLEEVIYPLALNWGGRILKILIILVLTRLAMGFGNALIHRIFAPTEDKPSYIPENKVNTLIALLSSILRYVLYALAGVLILAELGLEIGPILAGAGVLGLAVGFGAQNLVRDLLGGFFIILEDQFSVGDFITTGSYSGIVEELGLRITKIRDFGGELHILPNGMIETVTNRTRGNMRAMVHVGVAYEEDVDHVLVVLEELMREFGESEQDVVEGPTVLGVVELADSSVEIRIIARTEPMTQWQVERNMLRAIKNKFDELGIEIPYPRRVIYDRGNDKEENQHG